MANRKPRPRSPMHGPMPPRRWHGSVLVLCLLCQKATCHSPEDEVAELKQALQQVRLENTALRGHVLELEQQASTRHGAQEPSSRESSPPPRAPAPPGTPVPALPAGSYHTSCSNCSFSGAGVLSCRCYTRSSPILRSRSDYLNLTGLWSPAGAAAADGKLPDKVWPVFRIVADQPAAAAGSSRSGFALECERPSSNNDIVCSRQQSFRWSETGKLWRTGAGTLASPAGAAAVAGLTAQLDNGTELAGAASRRWLQLPCLALLPMLAYKLPAGT